MNRRVFILPGGAGRNDAYWYTWLARQLQGRFSLDADTVVVGHSFGGLTALKWLEIAGQKVAGLVLIDTSVKKVFETPQNGKIEKIRQRYLESWNWKLDVRRAAGYARRGAVLSERRTEQTYAAWKPGQVEFARALHCRLVSGLGRKQHFTARQEPLVLKTVLHVC